MVEILFIESFKIVLVKLISICKIRKIYFNGIYEKNWHDVVTLSMIKKGNLHKENSRKRNCSKYRHSLILCIAGQMLQLRTYFAFN